MRDPDPYGDEAPSGPDPAAKFALHLRAQRRLRLESRVVAALLAHYGLPGLKRFVAERHEELFGEKYVSLSAFCALAPGFPYFMAARSAGALAKISFASVFASRWSLRKVNEAIEEIEVASRGRRHGAAVVFGPLVGPAGRALVATRPSGACSGMRFTVPGRGLVLQSLNDFVACSPVLTAEDLGRRS